MAEEFHPEDASMAVVAARLRDVRTELALMRNDNREDRALLVTRAEWQQRNHHVDQNFTAAFRAIDKVKDAQESRRPNWTAVVSAVVAAVAVGIVIIQAMNP